MRRREFIAALGGAAVAWPLVARAQQSMPVVGFLGSSSPEGASFILPPFHEGLREGGYIVGQNVATEYRWANFQNDHYSALAAELVQRQVNAIMTSGSVNAAQAAKTATRNIPIVFVNGGDPVALGLVASLNRPAGNVTGITSVIYELGPKRLGLLQELLPKATTVAMLANLSNPLLEGEIRNLQSAARALGIELNAVHVASEDDFTATVAILSRMKPEALIISGDPFFITRARKVVELVLQCDVPAFFSSRIFADVGGLMSYGPSLSDLYRQAGVYVTKILKGTKPADLPVMQPTKFELVINLRTARAIGLTVPATLLARADEVIE